MKKIKLCGKNGLGKFAMVDNEDFENFSKIRWGLSPKGYVLRQKSKNYSRIILHRQILNLKDFKEEHTEVDHINGDKLDNRKSNLRTCTHQQNLMNRRKKKTNRSGYKGVSFNDNRWVASIMLNRKNIVIGRFIDKLEAAKAYDKKAVELFGEFAYLNKV